MYIKHKNDARVKINCKKYKERSFVFMGRVTLNYELVVRDDCIDKEAEKGEECRKRGLQVAKLDVIECNSHRMSNPKIALRV